MKKWYIQGMKYLALPFVLFLISQTAFALPAQVLIIRHGEKPKKGNELNSAGRKRAVKLAPFFETNPAVNQYGQIAAIYAMAPKDATGTLRPIETVTPTAQALGLTLNTSFQKDEITALAQSILSNPLYNGRTVLICWEHDVIPTITAALGLETSPKSWDGDKVFDRMWILTYATDGSVRFQDVGEHVLSGDSL
jgi:hypothetical protein